MTAHLPVSVVIPAYNGARFLPAAISSIRAQTRLPAEIIVVDDGSRDDTSAVATALGVRVIRRENGGISAARNDGIAAATQPWIALLDCDDRWHPTKLERQWAAHLRFPEAVLIATDAVNITNSGRVLDASMAHREITRFNLLRIEQSEDTLMLHRHAFDDLPSMGWFLLPSMVMLNRESLLAANGFDVQTRYMEDVDCFLRVLRFGPMAFVNEVLVEWVQHGSNVSSNMTVMRKALLNLHDKVCREPSLFPPALRESLSRDRPAVMLELARTALEDPEIGPATSLALDALRVAPSGRALLILAASILPRTLVQSLLKKRGGAISAVQ